MVFLPQGGFRCPVHNIIFGQMRENLNPTKTARK